MEATDKAIETLNNESKVSPAQTCGPCVLVMFGASGDLTRRKLIPALYNLAHNKLLPERFAILGFSRQSVDTVTFRDQMNSSIREYATGAISEEIWQWLLARLHSMTGDYQDPRAYEKLKAELKTIDEEHGTQGNYLFYLATPPALFPSIVQNLGAQGLTEERDRHWRRVVIEKPFGSDLESARRLNEQLAAILRETQVYRIDHYLGKETVQNLLVFRFGNGIFEPVWNRRYVDHVQITVAETVGVEKRASYFEGAGTLRDMVPSHVLQLLALIAMEPPISFSAGAIHDEKAKVLYAIPSMSKEDVSDRVVSGQYGNGIVNGISAQSYRLEPGVRPDSATETFVALKLMIDNWRWAGVPFYIRTGKRMPRRVTEIAIEFKRPPLLLFKKQQGAEISPNVLVIRVFPKEGISLRFGAKIPGPTLRLGNVDMMFSYKDYFGTTPNTGYETLLFDAICGDQTLFRRADSVEAGWAVIDPIMRTWKERVVESFPNYAAGSSGPKESDELLAKDGRQWRRIE